MSLMSDQEFRATREKLKELEQSVDRLKAQANRTRAEEVSIRSLTQLINQLKVEIARYESRTSV